MEYNSIFERTELKYLLTAEQAALIKASFASHMKPDAFGKTTISNIYYDTPDSRLIRHSIEKPVYKEKLRVRSYKVAKADDIVFVELKKKYKGIVYKRRVGMTQKQAEQYLRNEIPAPKQCQITSEMDYFKSFYAGLKPAMYISYDREAFYDKDDDQLRITFDRNIMYRSYDLSLQKGAYGENLLGRDQVLMEIKAGGAIPLWLTDILSPNHIYKTSFSKYGNAYLSDIAKGVRKYA